MLVTARQGYKAHAHSNVLTPSCEQLLLVLSYLSSTQDREHQCYISTAKVHITCTCNSTHTGPCSTRGLVGQSPLLQDFTHY